MLSTQNNTPICPSHLSPGLQEKLIQLLDPYFDDLMNRSEDQATMYLEMMITEVVCDQEDQITRFEMANVLVKTAMLLRSIEMLLQGQSSGSEKNVSLANS